VVQPLYQQIADDLRQQIESGKLAPGAQLPVELELREQYDASRNTIRDAIKRLTSLGLVQRRPGQGTFVAHRINPFVTELTLRDLSSMAEANRRARWSQPKVEIQVSREDISGQLAIPAQAQVISRQQERYIDEIPWSLETSFYPMDFAMTGNAHRLLMAEDITGGTVHYLEQTMGIQQVGYRDWITARGPDSNEQEFFSLAHDATVFEIFRTAFDQHGDPLRVTVTVFPTDRNQFIINVGKVPSPEYRHANQADLPAQASEPA
jgi:GntR family transcriptional regulator